MRLRQVQGLALVNSGAIERANRILEELESEGQTEETLGLLARTHKDGSVPTACAGRRTSWTSTARRTPHTIPVSASRASVRTCRT